MKTVGIAAEYNPFHEGHKFHLAEAKRLSGADRAIVVMSGSFVQRGEPACADKFTRAKWAMDNGADLVIELPDVFSLSCAERFASGAMGILAGTGAVDSICFGSESGDIGLIREIASGTIDNAAFEEAISKGLPYPAAMAKACGYPLLPNDILAVEYVRAVNRIAPDTEIYAVKRQGSGYEDDELNYEYSSAKAIRKAFSNYDSFTRMSPAVFDSLSRALPREELEEISDLIRQGAFPATDRELSEAVLCAFRSMSAQEISSFPEVAEGLENLYKKHSSAGSYEKMLSGVKSKRYTMARLKRISMCALLGITASLQSAAMQKDALYARILAVKEGSDDLLKLICEKADIPVILKAADRNRLCKTAAEIERISAKAHAIRAIGQPYDKSFVEDASHRLIVR